MGRFETIVGDAKSKKLQVEVITLAEPQLSDLPIAAHVAEIRAMEAQQAASRRRLDDLFHSILHRAFQGEL